MGNLRDKYTDEEWDEINHRIVSQSKKGKPREDFLHLGIWNKDADDLKKIKSTLSGFFREDQLIVLDKWIKWKERNE